MQRRRASAVRTGCVLIESMRLRRTGRPRTGLSPALGVLRLSALWAVSSLRTDLFPQFGADTLSLRSARPRSSPSSPPRLRPSPWRAASNSHAGAARSPVPASVSSWFGPRGRLRTGLVRKNGDYDPVSWLKYFRRAWTNFDLPGWMTRMTFPPFEMRMRYGWCKRPVSSVHATSSARSS